MRRSASGIPPSIATRILGLLAMAAVLAAGCGLLPDSDRSPGDRAETLATDSEDGPPPASPDGGEGAVLVALVASLYRHHRPGLTLAVSVLGLPVALAAFANSAL